MKFDLKIVLLIFMACLFYTQASHSIEQIEISIENIFYPLLSSTVTPDSQKANTKEASEQSKIPSIKAKPSDLKFFSAFLDISQSPTILTINLKQFNLPEPFNGANSLSITCNDLKVTHVSIGCQKGLISISGLFGGINNGTKKSLSKSQANFKVNYNTNRSELELSIDSLAIAETKLALEVHINKSNWTASMNVSSLNYQDIAQYLNFYLNKAQVNIEDPYFQLNLSGHLSGALQGPTLKQFDIQGHVKNLKYTMRDNLAENMFAGFKISFNQLNDTQQVVTVKLDKLKGELFQNDIYINFQGNESINTTVKYDRVKQFVDVQRLKVTFPGIVNLSGDFNMSLKPRPHADKLAFNLKVDDFKQFNDLYLKNILEGTDYEELDIKGGFQAEFEKQYDQYKLTSNFGALSLSYNKQVTVVGLNGILNWTNRKLIESEIKDSQLRWEELILNDLPFGQANLNFRFYDEQLKLLKETDIPLFDGSLHINTLDISQLGIIKQYHTGLTLTIDGMIKPISLEQVSSHFNWPLLDGQLSAVIPSTTYNRHFLKVGGAIMLKVFDGVTIIKDLQIEQPLSESARMYADIDLNNLNLQSLTKTYNFGEIEGRIEGKFSNLILDSWQPVQFDAYFRTPENDKSRHRISQRAIDNLSSLGGASGILSRSFLSFFQTFGYDKLGLSCKLKNSICLMDGIENKSGDSAGYYIVKGGGVPRIDVMGFQRKVNWQVLTSRLQAIQSANEAVIE